MPAAGVATLYLLGLREHVDLFWTIVLVPAFLSYAMVPFLPCLPPRSLPGHSEATRATATRKLNLWSLKHASIQANTFPSGHVAMSFAIAFALLALIPAICAVWSDSSAWYFGYSLTTLIAGASLILYSFWVSLGGQPVFEDPQPSSATGPK